MSWRGRLSPVVRTVSTFLNPKDPMCFGVRNWWRQNLPELQMLNPQTSFQIQELSFGEPHMIVWYTHTDNRLIRLAGATEEEMDEIMEAVGTYANTHAIIDYDGMPIDDGSTQITGASGAALRPIISFGYAESFLAKLEPKSPSYASESFVADAVDDPGQKLRKMQNNSELKLLP